MGTTDDDNFAALDFGDGPGHDGGTALDFGDGPVHDSADQSVTEVLDTDEPAEPADADSKDAIDSQSEGSADAVDTREADDEISWQLAKVTNPAETVSVTAVMSGQIHRVDLSPRATSMTESELAEEIRVIADLARKRALSTQHRLLLESFHALGADDDEALRGFLEEGMKLSSPEQASRAQSEVFATRYVSRND